ARASRAGAPRGRRRGVVRVDFPLRALHGGAGEGAPRSGGHPRAHGMMDGEVVIERLAEQPGGAELLEVAREHADVALVGGAVRDLLLELEPRELDVVVSGDAARLVSELAERVPDAHTTVHDRFGTAVVQWGAGLRIDIAER